MVGVRRGLGVLRTGLRLRLGCGCFRGSLTCCWLFAVENGGGLIKHAAELFVVGEETTKQKARSEAAASEAQSKPGSQNS